MDLNKTVDELDAEIKEVNERIRSLTAKKNQLTRERDLIRREHFQKCIQHDLDNLEEELKTNTVYLPPFPHLFTEFQFKVNMLSRNIYFNKYLIYPPVWSHMLRQNSFSGYEDISSFVISSADEIYFSNVNEIRKLDWGCKLWPYVVAFLEKHLPIRLQFDSLKHDDGYTLKVVNKDGLTIGIDVDLKRGLYLPMFYLKK